MIEAGLEKYLIRSGRTIREAMLRINDNWREIVLVQDADGLVCGAITDGDIRRGILRGETLESPVEQVMNREFVSVGPDMDRAGVLDMMKALMIRQMPVLDREGRLQCIHFLNDLLGAAVKPNVAVIMAGGEGVRLRPLTENCPKPMIRVAGRPILERVVLHLIGYGIRKIYLSINYLGGQIESHFGDGSKFGCDIEYLREDAPLGTGGALSLLPPQQHPVVVMNGDQVTQANIDKLLRSHEEEGGVATIGIRHYQMEIPFGVVINEGKKLVGIQEKPTSHYLINTGIYILDPHVLALVPKNELYPITTLFDRLLAENRPVSVHYFDEDWIDVGRHDDLHKARGIF